MAAKKHYDKVLSSLSEGTKVRAVAFDDDGGGDARRRAYEKLGFRHQGNNVLTGVISKGKVEGADFSESSLIAASVWERILSL